MTFHTIGLTSEGKRILKFDHDGSRRHSPIIDQMGEVYIVENKSVAAYLRQLKEMGEDVNEYRARERPSLASVFMNTRLIPLRPRTK